MRTCDTKQTRCCRAITLKCAPPRNRMLRTETPLSPGALPAISVVGGPPSFCARRSSPRPIIMCVLSRAGRANRIDAFVQGWANNETAELLRNGRNIIVALTRGDFLKQSLDMPGRENDQHPNGRVR